MAVNYSQTVANARLDVVRSALNAGGGGKVILKTSGGTPLCSVNLETSIGAAVAKVLTVIATAKQGTATGAGTAALADLVDGSATVVASGLTVGTSAADILLNDLVIANGSLVTINSGTITHP